ncbi:uncharacterized protein [Coffea arabica]|uniref:Uncharacterized protein n=1 Tax=Coffea arabica TaxID=13443 RepID=A0ABM4U1D7_COFAR
MKSVLLEFTNLSVLTSNLNKSEVFLAGVSDELGAQLCPMQRGSFPVRYLGVPLISTRLSVSDCALLIEKVQKKVRGWNSKLITYAVRLQLVESVLLNLQIYWSSTFLIPKTVIKKIEAVVTAFLWKGTPTAKTGIKVSWQEMQHQFPVIAHGTEGTYFNSGQLLVPTSFQPLSVVTGEDTFLWHDNWHARGALLNYCGPDIVRQYGSSLHAKVSSIIQHGVWMPPTGSRRTAAVVDFIQYLPPTEYLDPSNKESVKVDG